MDRIQFIKTCGLACLSGTAIFTLLQGCASGNYLASSVLENSDLKVSKSEFTKDKNGNAIQRKYVLVKYESLKFPIYLYQLNEAEYSAVWMECTHQGSELSAHGEYLSCPSHGSEFDKVGKVTNGPAQENLRKFATRTDEQFIYIRLS